MADSPSQRTQVFISYSHRDAEYLKRLQAHLRPYIRDGSIHVWDDTQIEAGADWLQEIERAIQRAKVAVLLVSVDFLASEFVAEKELPKFLEAARDEGARILPVIVGTCDFNKTQLGKFQAVNSPTTPLKRLSEDERDEVWVQVARLIQQTLTAVPGRKAPEPDLEAGGAPLRVPAEGLQTPVPSLTSTRHVKRARFFLAGAITIFLLLILLLGLALHASLGTNVAVPQASVTNLHDEGPGSLRQAIANGNAGSIITFANTLSGTILLTSGEIVINKELTINGPGAEKLAVSGDHLSRVFRVPSAVSVSISGLTITQGNTSEFGGGILNFGDLKLTNMFVSQNAASSGGGIANENPGTLTITNSIISENTSSGGVGGIGSGGPLTIISSTVSGNIGRRSGGLEIGLSLNLLNSTVTRNVATDSGGGIVIGGGGEATIYYSTIYANEGGQGGNIHTNNLNTTTVRVHASIIADGSAAFGPDIFGTVVVFAGYDLIQNVNDPNTQVVNDPTNHNLFGVSPGLGTLQSNGGPTPTLALSPGSPAIDYIPPADCTDSKNDQRGIARPQGNGCDIGAYEYVPTGSKFTFLTVDFNLIGPRNSIPQANTGIRKRRYLDVVWQPGYEASQ